MHDQEGAVRFLDETVKFITEAMEDHTQSLEMYHPNPVINPFKDFAHEYKKHTTQGKNPFLKDTMSYLPRFISSMTSYTETHRQRIRRLDDVGS